MSKAAPAVADRVLAIGSDGSRRELGGMLPEMTADDDAVAVDCGSVGMRETTLWPPTVGNHPLVLSVFVVCALNASGIVPWGVVTVCWVMDCEGE